MWPEPFAPLTSVPGTTAYTAPSMQCMSLIPKRHANQPTSRRILPPTQTAAPCHNKDWGQTSEALLAGKWPSGPVTGSVRSRP